MSKLPPLVKPHIGMPVWYWPSTAMSAVMRMAYDDTAKPMAAFVVYTWHDSMCNIVATDHRGQIHAITSVTFVPPGQRPDEGRDFCELPTSQLLPPAPDKHQPAEAWPVPAGHSAPETLPPANTAPEEPPTSVSDADILGSVSQCYHVNAREAVAACVQDELAGVITDGLPVSLNTTDLCFLVLHNGHVVIGASHCLSRDNYRREQGRINAQRRAFEQVRDLLAYELRSVLVGINSPAA